MANRSWPGYGEWPLRMFKRLDQLVVGSIPSLVRFETREAEFQILRILRFCFSGYQGIWASAYLSFWGF